jgi:hypothetical protein
MPLSPRPSSFARQKEALEVRKLRTDIAFAKLTFFAQLFNTLCITILGAVVFYYFQRAQIDQAASIYILDRLEKIRGSDVDEQAEVSRRLADAWPDRYDLQQIAFGYEVDQELKRIRSNSCEELYVQYMGAIESSRPGQAIPTLMIRYRVKYTATRAAMTSKKCSQLYR